MIICGDRLDFNFCEKIAKDLDATIFYPEIVSFPDSEMKVSIYNTVVGKEVLLIKLFEPKEINSEILKTAFTIDALKRAGAKKVSGFLPYFPYVRSDHQKKSGESVNLEVIARLFEAAGLDSLITIDPHTIKFPQFFKIPVEILSTTSLFAREIGKMIKNKPFSLVSPDNGGLRLIRPLSDIFHHASITTITKERFPDGSVEATEIEGKVEGICVIVDDIIATGGTIIESMKILKKNGAKEFYVFATHGVFSKITHDAFRESSIKSAIVTNSVIDGEDVVKGIKKLPIQDLLIQHLKS